MDPVEKGAGASVSMSRRGTLRVAVCYTGSVGVRAIRLIAARPDLDLVGVLVRAPAKAGVDAGALAGIGRLGVVTTAALSDVVALAPHCVIWAGKGWQPDEVCVLLGAGINVYVPVGAWYLPGDPDFARVDAACRRGGATLVGGGSIPGLVSDVLPLFLSGYVGNLRCVRAVQSNLIGDYPSADQLRSGLGFGTPIPLDASATSDPRDLRWVRYISQSARMVADAVGFTFGSLRLTAKEFAAAPRDIPLDNGLSIPAGSVAGVRWEFTGVTAEDVTFYSLIKEQVAVAGLGPTWRSSAQDPQWRVEIAGTPSLRCDLTPVAEDGFGATTAELNAARAVNLIPRIVAAPAGCKSVLDFAAPVGAAMPITVE